MGTHHILKDGTLYSVTGGTTLTNGVKYQIGGVDASRRNCL